MIIQAFPPSKTKSNQPLKIIVFLMSVQICNEQNVIEEKLRYSGITKIELYINSGRVENDLLRQ